MQLSGPNFGLGGGARGTEPLGGPFIFLEFSTSVLDNKVGGGHWLHLPPPPHSAASDCDIKCRKCKTFVVSGCKGPPKAQCPGPPRPKFGPACNDHDKKIGFHQKRCLEVMEWQVTWISWYNTDLLRWRVVLHINSMKLVILLHFISWTNSFSDISILPNMTRVVTGNMHLLLITENCQSSPKWCLTPQYVSKRMGSWLRLKVLMGCTWLGMISTKRHPWSSPRRLSKRWTLVKATGITSTPRWLVSTR